VLDYKPNGKEDHKVAKFYFGWIYNFFYQNVSLYIDKNRVKEEKVEVAHAKPPKQIPNQTWKKINKRVDEIHPS
jgi:hypothetical protein